MTTTMTTMMTTTSIYPRFPKSLCPKASKNLSVLRTKTAMAPVYYFATASYAPAEAAAVAAMADSETPAIRIPPARPAGDPTNNSKDPNNSCSESSTATDYWVSCESKGPTSTSCTTTSSMLHVGCDVSASTTTTGENVCHLIDWDEDQGDDSKNRPSDNPDPKPTSTTSTTSKTTLTSTATSTTTTGKPVPSGLPSSRDDIQFVIFAPNRITDDESTWRWAGYLLPNPGYDDEDVCNEKYEVLSDPDVEDDQAWPISMGPFNAPDLDYCWFHKTGDPPNNPGYVSCSNHLDLLPCIGLDGKHAVRNPAHTCTGSGGEKTEFWLQAWCPLKG
ncbi:hypothetical protein N7444_012867 [Penicillium canescens]|nr:hypothetical protein N7444_012867 [Penicillium canescens]